MKPALVRVMVAVGALSMLAWAEEEGPGRGVARISVINGDVSVRRGDAGEWIAAAINAPLVVQDRLFCGPLSRAELQFDYANMIRVDENSEVRLSELEYQRYQVQIARGTVMFRVLRDSRSDVELSTPSVSVRPLKRGSYRVTVREDGTSEITVRSGEAEIYTPRGAERLTSGRTMLARGSASDPEFQTLAAIRNDDWDRWNDRRDHDLERARSYRYVSSDIYGAEDLDGHGEWVDAPGYGSVWAPYVTVGWAPYRYGRWMWVDWYGWSWVSYDPWGWAPYHYGRWFYYSNRWCWWPGGMHGRHYWSPALVAFFGWGHHSGFGVGFGGGFGNVGWIPLAPHEPFYPWYGHRYYSGYRNSTYIDNSVHVVNNVNITNVYKNARINNAVTAVNAGDFTRGRAGNVVRVSDNEMRGAGLIRGQVPLAPDRASLRMADREVGRTAIPRTSDDARFFSRRQPAAVDRVAFDEQRRGIEQVSRRTFGESRGAETPAGGRVANTEPARGWRQADAPSRTDIAPRTADTNRTEQRGAANSGWRRNEAPAARGVETAPSRREATDGNSWRRFGDAGRGPAAVDRQRTESSAPRSESPTGTRGDISGGGSRRDATGDAGRRIATPPSRVELPSRTDTPSRSEERAPTRRENRDNESWRRFSSGPSPSTPEIRGGGSAPSRMQTAPSYERPRMDAPRYERREAEPLRISPPIVRERSTPRFEDRGSIGRMPESRPQMSAPAPRSMPQMSAPAQRSAPQMSAPASRGGGEVRGGGGGGRGDGGGGGRGEGRSSGRGR